MLQKTTKQKHNLIKIKAICQEHEPIISYEHNFCRQILEVQITSKAAPPMRKSHAICSDETKSSLFILLKKTGKTTSFNTIYG